MPASEATAVQSSEECMLAGEATGKPQARVCRSDGDPSSCRTALQAWHIVFCYNGQPTVLPVPVPLSACPVSAPGEMKSKAPDGRGMASLCYQLCGCLTENLC